MKQAWNKRLAPAQARSTRTPTAFEPLEERCLLSGLSFIQPRADYPTGDSPVFVVTADFNGDAVCDISDLAILANKHLEIILI